MDENEIRCALSNYKDFGGVFAFDEKPRLNGPIGVVINTEESSKSGLHWISVYVDEYGNGEFFDSLASPTTFKQFEPYLKENCVEFLIPTFPIQSSISRTCGIYASAFLALRFEECSLYDFMNIFSRRTIANDIIIGRILNAIKEEESRCDDHISNKLQNGSEER